MNKKKSCIFIIPYFGSFNNYFNLFLKSCENNPNYKWLLISDITYNDKLPQNVKIIKITFEENKKLYEKKLGFKIILNSFHDLCEFKPLYGFFYDEFIKEYKYWGYCDCDLLFGKLDNFLPELMNEDYDKIFAAGHLTIIKNTIENNTLFKSTELYRKVFTSKETYGFDEDYFDENIHSIFLNNNKKVYAKDISMNSSTKSGKFIREYYDEKTRTFKMEKYIKARYFWKNGEISRYYFENGIVKKEDFLYMHFQNRKMRNKIKNIKNDQFEILPDRFIDSNIDLKRLSKKYFIFANFSYLYLYDKIIKKIKRKLNK